MSLNRVVSVIIALVFGLMVFTGCVSVPAGTTLNGENVRYGSETVFEKGDVNDILLENGVVVTCVNGWGVASFCVVAENQDARATPIENTHFEMTSSKLPDGTDLTCFEDISFERNGLEKTCLLSSDISRVVSDSKR